MTPQSPQFCSSVVLLMHAPPQSFWSVPLHDGTHAPPAQLSLVAQTVLHAPQLNLSVPMSTHAVPH